MESEPVRWLGFLAKENVVRAMGSDSSVLRAILDARASEGEKLIASDAPKSHPAVVM
ncbi:hypothetical protein SEA_SIXAMA_140 [Gordonia phage Sixama]|uniref:Uncharacterized protein n=1 Tax=Gordonia phage Sixama TaxID=2653271 RepID=A0A5Q2F0M2_9CAUD|nr:hypothetical protein PP302_gp169 [Gordonia phage Sixama]QGF20310.1 hypothetical protein SEA_SIXAMA_140 [Gordonia phage Sixama]